MSAWGNSAHMSLAAFQDHVLCTQTCHASRLRSLIECAGNSQFPHGYFGSLSNSECWLRTRRQQLDINCHKQSLAWWCSVKGLWVFSIVDEMHKSYVDYQQWAEWEFVSECASVHSSCLSCYFFLQLELPCVITCSVSLQVTGEEAAETPTG